MKLAIAEDCGDFVEVQVKGSVTQKEVNPSLDPLGDLLGPGGYGKCVVLDLSDAQYLDSSGVGWLLGCHKRFRQGGGKLVVHSLQPIVANVLRVLKLDTVLLLAPDGRAAREALHATSSATTP
jgi:anti-sigma B factor antagonist